MAASGKQIHRRVSIHRRIVVFRTPMNQYTTGTQSFHGVVKANMGRREYHEKETSCTAIVCGADGISG